MIILGKKVSFLVQEETIQTYNGVLKNVNQMKLSARERSCCLSLSARMSIFTTYTQLPPLSPFPGDQLYSRSIFVENRSPSLVPRPSSGPKTLLWPHNVHYRHSLSLISENPSLPPQCLFMVIFYDRSVVLCVPYRPPPAGALWPTK